jgi:3'(2'), 5'-bisphosphate nucleotidase
MNREPFSSIHAIAVAAALQAGEAIMRVYHDTIHIDQKDDGSPVTQADNLADDIILGHLRQTPYPVISEESLAPPYEERKTWTHAWLVDPLDGTKEFIRRNGEFTVNIALVSHGHPVFGVILAPHSRKLWVGLVDKGVYRMGDTVDWPVPSPEPGPEWLGRSLQRIVPPQGEGTELIKGFPAGSRVIIGTSRSHRETATEALIARLREHYGRIGILHVGSSLKFCEMAEGNMGIYPRCTPIFEWDTAAGHAILKAAGGEVYGLETGKPLSYNKEDLRSAPFIAFSTREGSDSYFAELAPQVGIGNHR